MHKNLQSIKDGIDSVSNTLLTIPPNVVVKEENSDEEYLLIADYIVISRAGSDYEISIVAVSNGNFEDPPDEDLTHIRFCINIPTTINAVVAIYFNDIVATRTNDFMDALDLEDFEFVDYKPAICVRCHECDKEFAENTVDFVNIYEDIIGRDVVTFNCPNCKKQVESFRR